MFRYPLNAVLACLLACGSTAQAQGNGGNLFIGGIPLTETQDNYLRAIKYLTVAPKHFSHPTFAGTDIQAIRTIEDPLRRQIYTAMAYNRSERFEFATLTRAQENFTMRVAAVYFMVRMGMKVSNGGLDFNYHRPGEVPGEADGKNWRKVAEFQFLSLPNARASDAIDGISKAKYRGECFGALEITVLQAAHIAVGSSRFNAMHPRGLKVGDQKGKLNLRHFRNATRISPADMVPGDWVYMKNQDDYNRGLRPGVNPGPWQGENAIYMGRYDVGPNRTPTFRAGAPPRYSGLGVYNADEAKLRQSLKNGYTKLMRPPNTLSQHTFNERNVRWTSVRRLVTGD